MTSGCTRTEDQVAEEFLVTQDEKLLKELEPMLRKHAYAVVWVSLRRHDKDIVNKAVFQGLQGIKTFRGDAKFSSFFYGIVRNLCTDWIRTKTSRKEEQLEATQAVTVDAVDGLDAAIELEQIADRLSDRDREFLAMKYRGETDREIAKALGITRGGVRANWSRLRKKIRRVAK